jgi:hypothetical protein
MPFLTNFSVAAQARRFFSSSPITISRARSMVSVSVRAPRAFCAFSIFAWSSSRCLCLGALLALDCFITSSSLCVHTTTIHVHAGKMWEGISSVCLTSHSFAEDACAPQHYLLQSDAPLFTRVTASSSAANISSNNVTQEPIRPSIQSKDPRPRSRLLSWRRGQDSGTLGLSCAGPSGRDPPLFCQAYSYLELTRRCLYLPLLR